MQVDLPGSRWHLALQLFQSMATARLPDVIACSGVMSACVQGLAAKKRPCKLVSWRRRVASNDPASGGDGSDGTNPQRGLLQPLDVTFGRLWYAEVAPLVLAVSGEAP